MEKIYVITTTARIGGHGEAMDEQVLYRYGIYGSNGLCPAFKSKADAREWAKRNGVSIGRITELEVR